MQIEQVPISQLNPAPYNPRTIDKKEFSGLKKSLETFGFVDPAIVNKRNNTIVGGHMRIQAWKQLGNTTAPVVFVDLDDHDERKLNVVLNSQAISGQYDELKLAELLEAFKVDDDYDALRLGELEPADGSTTTEEKGSLNDKFLVPPFSVLDTRQGYWQDHKKKWLAMGIESEKGRDDALLYGAAKGRTDIVSQRIMQAGGGTSVFDPVLCELMYKWFNKANGIVIDPFAGGSVRGVVASTLNMPYVGLELRKEQVDANVEQAERMELTPMPTWLPGDSAESIPQLIEQDFKADMLFTCPPYADLEVYSDDPRDLSNMPYKDFLSAYTNIIVKACMLLRDNSFAVVVVGEVRDKKGIYYNFVGDTINAFITAGLAYYNEMILVNSIGSLPLRAGKTFNSGRKIGKVHQNVLVFYKGNPKEIKNTFGEVEMPELTEDVENPED